MKVRPINPDLGYLQQPIREKSGDGQAGQQDRNSSKDFERNLKKEEETIEVTELQVTQAIESFQADAQTKSLGLSAEGVGVGPGLRVLLKDQKGKVLRQISAEEFLKLREAVQETATTRGKILDQKM